MKPKQALRILNQLRAAFALTEFRKRTMNGSARVRKTASFLDVAEYQYLFDIDHYRSTSRIAFKSKKEGLNHFFTTPPAELAAPHPLFDPQWYLNTYRDVAFAQINPLLHFVSCGAKEGRSPSPYFDTRFYYETYPDIAAADTNPLIHYLEHGALEGRNPSADFHTRWYLEAYPDVLSAQINPLVHYVLFGRFEGRSSFKPASVQLDEASSLAPGVFSPWRDQLYLNLRSRDAGTNRKPAQRNGADLRSDAPYKKFLIAIRGDKNAALRSATQDSVKSARDLGHECSAHVVDHYVYSEIADLASRIERERDDIAFAILIEAGDHIDLKGFERLAAQLTDRVSLCVFDSYFEKDDRVFPVLQPGANRGQLRETDAVFSRFAIRADDLLTSARGLREPGPYLLLTRTLDTVSANRELDRFVHCAFPVLRTTDLSETIADMRAALITTPRPAAKVAEASVSVIICTKNKAHLTDQLIGNLVNASGRTVKEVFVVSNNTDNLYAKETLHRWSECPQVKIIEYNKSFNFSEQCNIAACQSTGDYLLMLNDDVVPVTPDWLSKLVARFDDPTIGAVGPLLLYPNENVQHAGMYLGLHGGAGHMRRHAKLPDEDYLVTATCPRDVSCVTGAVLLLRRSTFDALNGFDTQLSTIFQDVDLCIRLTNSGLRILYDPTVILLHMESVSINSLITQPGILEQRAREFQYFCQRHGRQKQGSDAFYNPLFAVDDESMRTLAS